VNGPKGELAIVLHTHMPYVEGFGTWPFGEEWLWEAISGSYLPLLDLLDTDAPLTLSLTPVLCDQLEAPGVGERFEAFVEQVRGRTHAEDIAGLRAGGHETLARELERAWAEYEQALERFRGLGGDLLGGLARHAQWTSSATHAVLPLLATDAGVRAQVQTGVDSHRARFAPTHPSAGGGLRPSAGGWNGGFWLPECAHAPYLEPLLEEAGVRSTCVELTGRYGLGASEHLRPLVGEAGVVLVPIDRMTISHVWSETGYPAHGGYRDYHHHTIHHHTPWANDGSAYDYELARGLTREHARDFVARTIERLRGANEAAASVGSTGAKALPGGGLVVCALDTELLGHWWYEGVEWLRAVVEECSRQGLALVRLDEAQAMRDPAPVDSDEWEASTWGKGGDLSTWSGPAVAEMAFLARSAELQTLAAGPRAGAIATRELLALQASDWAFMVSGELAAPYARERFAGHLDALRRALDDGPDSTSETLRNLASHVQPTALLGP
jgi:1,4-alpha-glucan branching enzyme